MTVQKENAKANRLINETSTYLRQHAYNPVDWYPWGEEALSKARQEDKPILLSIGYSACHWCHVMEHESFEDDSTAEIMNKFFVNIKVDREERTDLDEIYMKAVQMLTGHGGWPMTVFLTPQLKPFYAGTYFPPQDRHGIPAFKRILMGVNHAWTNQRDDVEESSADITKHLALFDKTDRHEKPLDESILNTAVDTLSRVFDQTWGGFGGAPKFPHAATTSFLSRRMKAGSPQKTSRELECLQMVTLTLDRMAGGGMYDQIGGGFARYSVDRKWLIPHFEKMLYDNALLIPNYLDGYLITGKRFWARVARESLEFVLRELHMAEGGFFCSLDADSEGEEGKFYVWRPEEITEVLGETDGKWFCEVFGVSKSGNFEHGTSALNFTALPEELARQNDLSEEEFWKKLDPLREKLLQARGNRIRPGRDEKMLTSWTSLMLSAFIAGYRVLGEDRYLQVAKKAAEFILGTLYVNGRLLRTYGIGKARLNAYLDDYAYFIQALLDLAAVDGDPRWLTKALELNDVVLRYFADEEDGGFFFTSSDHEELITRGKHFYDGSTPSASSVTVMNLLRLSRLTDQHEFQDLAQKTLSLYAEHMAQRPDQFSNFLCGLDFLLAPPTEIAIIYDSKVKKPDELIFAVNSVYVPNAVTLAADASSPTGASGQSPLLKDRSPTNSEPTAFICQGYTCKQPLVDPLKVKEELTQIQQS